MNTSPHPPTTQTNSHLLEKLQGIINQACKKHKKRSATSIVKLYPSDLTSSPRTSKTSKNLPKPSDKFLLVVARTASPSYVRGEKCYWRFTVPSSIIEKNKPKIPQSIPSTTPTTPQSRSPFAVLDKPNPSNQPAPDTIPTLVLFIGLESLTNRAHSLFLVPYSAIKKKSYIHIPFNSEYQTRAFIPKNRVGKKRVWWEYNINTTELAEAIQRSLSKFL